MCHVEVDVQNFWVCTNYIHYILWFYSAEYTEDDNNYIHSIEWKNIPITGLTFLQPVSSFIYMIKFQMQNSCILQILHFTNPVQTFSSTNKSLITELEFNN